MSTGLPLGSIDWSTPPARAIAWTRGGSTAVRRFVETCQAGQVSSAPTAPAPRSAHSSASVKRVSPAGSAKAFSRVEEDSRIGVAATSPPGLLPGAQAPVRLSKRLTISGRWRRVGEPHLLVGLAGHPHRRVTAHDVEGAEQDVLLLGGGEVLEQHDGPAAA